MKQVSATEYKHDALKLLEQVRVSGETIQITKRGRPVAQLVRVDDESPKRILGQFRNEVTLVGDIVGPIISPEDWGGLV